MTELMPWQLLDELGHDPGDVCPRCGGYGVHGFDVPKEHELYTVLVDCECEAGTARKLEKAQRRLRAAKLPQALGALTFETLAGLEGQRNIDGEVIKLSERQKAAAQLGRQLADVGVIMVRDHERAGMFLHGKQGRGKSGIAVCVVRARLQAGEPGLYITVPDLLDHLRATFGPQSEVSYDDLFDQVRNIPTLVLDDLGTENPTAWAVEKLYQIVNHRYQQRLITLVTSNFSPGELAAQYDEMDDRMGKRIIDRLVASCAVVEVTGPNLRV